MTIGARILAALFVTMLAFSPARARNLDRRSAIRAALGQNPQVAAARAEEMAVEAQARQVDAARWPMVTLDAGVGPSFQATLVPGTVQSVEEQYRNLKLNELSAVFIGNLTVLQPLYTFGKISHRQEATSHGQKARAAQTRMQRSDIAFEVARIYEGYLLARDAERFFDETIHWLESTLQSTEDKLAQGIGSATERDVLRLQTGLGVAAMALHQAQAGVAQARAGLLAYLGLPAGENIVVAEPELTLVGPVGQDFTALVTLASKHRPELTALDEGQQALDALSRAEAAGLCPDVFAMAFISSAFTPGRDWVQSRFVVDPVNHFVPGAVVGLRWAFQGNMAGARANEQKARAEVLQHLSQWATAGIPAEVRKAYEDIQRANKDIEQGSQAVKKAKQWMVQAGADYAVGFLDVREVSDAVSAYTALRAALLRARFDHNVAMAALAKATGTLDGDSDLFYLAPANDGAKGIAP